MKTNVDIKNSSIYLYLIILLLCWAMPVNSMPVNTTSITNDKDSAIDKSTSSPIAILNKNFLYEFHQTSPEMESNIDSMLKNLTTPDKTVFIDPNMDIDLNIEEALKYKLTPQVIGADVAIIIDDLGYSKSLGLAAINIPGNLTYAIIPHSPYAKLLATSAHKKHKEIILHAPMSNIHNHPMGQSGLRDDMSEEDFANTLSDALASVPHITGVNNHMGSLLTQLQLPMEWTMKTLKTNGLYFIDSRTTPASVAWKTAQQFNIASLKRDVFLDHQRDNAFIEEQFERFISIAKRQGYAIAIGHPYPETIEYLKNNIHRLKAHGIRLKTASELVNLYSPNKHQQAKM
jgi:polysaccharide deacetylase 2 family uncharacterized protein YibQ